MILPPVFCLFVFVCFVLFCVFFPKCITPRSQTTVTKVKTKSKLWMNYSTSPIFQIPTQDAKFQHETITNGFYLGLLMLWFTKMLKTRVNKVQNESHPSSGFHNNILLNNIAMFFYVFLWTICLYYLDHWSLLRQMPKSEQILALGGKLRWTCEAHSLFHSRKCIWKYRLSLKVLMLSCSVSAWNHWKCRKSTSRWWPYSYINNTE